MTPETAIQLIAEHSDGTTYEVSLGPNQGVFVGKSTNCGLRFNDDEISDIHCRIGFEEGQLWVQDWMSELGTRVNGELLTCKSPVDCNAEVHVGPYKIQIRELPQSTFQTQELSRDLRDDVEEKSIEDDAEYCSIANLNRMKLDHTTSSTSATPSQLQAGQQIESFNVDPEASEESEDEAKQDTVYASDAPSAEDRSEQDPPYPSDESISSDEPVPQEQDQAFVDWSQKDLETAQKQNDSLDSHPIESSFQELDSLSAMALKEDEANSGLIADAGSYDGRTGEVNNDDQSRNPVAASDTPTDAPSGLTQGFGDDFNLFDTDGSESELSSDGDDIYDRETIALLQAEIENLRAELTARSTNDPLARVGSGRDNASDADEPHVAERIRELSEEANRAEERVILLEEMLQAADDANRGEVEERHQLEAWVGDIERRIGQREHEHAAELEALRSRLQSSERRYQLLQRELEQAASPDGDATEKFEESLQHLQLENSRLQNSLEEANKELQQLRHQIDNQSQQNDSVLREVRAKIAKEQAEVSRLKFTYTQKLEEISKNNPSEEPDPRLQALREHRQQIREQHAERQEQKAESSLSGRLKRLWSLVE